MSNNTIAKSGALLAASKFINLSISLVTFMLLARYRTRAEYGTYSAIRTVVSIATVLFCIGIPNCINFFLPKCENQDETNRVLSFIYISLTGVGILIGTVLYLSSSYIAAYYNNDEILRFSYILFLFPIAQIINGTRDNLLIASHQTTKVIIINILNTLSNLGIILLTQILKQDFAFYMLLFIINYLVFALWVYLEAFKLIDKIIISFPRDFVLDIFKYSIPIALSAVVSTTNIELDKLVIGHFFTPEQLAIYANCGKELPIVHIAASYSAVLMPFMVRRLKNNQFRESIDLWKITIEFNLIINTFFVVIFLVMAPEVITFLYSSKYSEGVDIFRIYSIMLLLRVTAFTIVLNSIGKTFYVMLCSVATLVLNVTFNLLSLYVLGFIGPAISTVVTTIIAVLLVLFISSRVIKISFSEVFPWKNTFYVVGTYFVLGIFLYCIYYLVQRYITSVNLLKLMIVGSIWVVISYVSFKNRFFDLWRKMRCPDV